MTCGYKSFFFVEIMHWNYNGWIMENIDRLAVPKWVLIIRPKIPQIPKNVFALFVCPSQKVLYFNEKRLHWASVVRDTESISNVNVSSESECAVSHRFRNFSCKILGYLPSRPLAETFGGNYKLKVISIKVKTHYPFDFIYLLQSL